MHDRVLSRLLSWCRSLSDNRICLKVRLARYVAWTVLAKYPILVNFLSEPAGSQHIAMSGVIRSSLTCHMPSSGTHRMISCNFGVAGGLGVRAHETPS